MHWNENIISHSDTCLTDDTMIIFVISFDMYALNIYILDLPRHKCAYGMHGA